MVSFSLFGVFGVGFFVFGGVWWCFFVCLGFGGMGLFVFKSRGGKNET